MTTTYCPYRGSPTGEAKVAARARCVVIVVERGGRQAKVPVRRRRNETQRQFAGRLFRAAQLIRAQRSGR